MPRRSLREQDAWDEHAAFMEALADQRFVTLGGKLGGTERVLLVVDAASEDDIVARLAHDPWHVRELLRTTGIERWEVLLSSL